MANDLLLFLNVMNLKVVPIESIIIERNTQENHLSLDRLIDIRF